MINGAKSIFPQSASGLAHPETGAAKPPPKVELIGEGFLDNAPDSSGVALFDDSEGVGNVALAKTASPRPFMMRPMGAVLVGALVIACLAAFPSIMRTGTSLENVEAQRLSVISAGIKNLYASRDDFNGLNNQLVLAAKIIPDDMPVQGGFIRNGWQGDVAIVPGRDPSMFAIAYSGVPAKACLKLGTGIGADFKSLSIGGVVIFERKAMPDGRSDFDPIDPVKVAAACQLHPEGSSMVFMGS